MDVLAASPRKKRALVDDSVTTPKRQRILTQQPTPATAKRTPASRRTAAASLPSELGRLKELQNAMQHALSHALATSAVAPDYDTGRVPNVVNHVSLASAAGAMALSYVPGQDDVRRLCWLWEWDAKALPPPKAPPKIASPKPSKSRVIADEEENPFLSPKAAPSVQQAPNDWFRGGMGFIVSATTHYNRAESRRVPAYGIGIEVDVAGEIDSGLGLGSGVGGGGMASVARWTAGGKARAALLQEKLDKWTQLHADAARVPLPPLADLPSLQTSLAAAKEETKRDKIAKLLLSPSPGGTIRSKPPGLETPGSPTRSPSASPTKRLFMSAGSSSGSGFGLGLGSRVASTPSRLNAKGKGKDDMFTIPFPPTPSDSELGTPTADRRGARPETPTHDRPETPTHTRPETPQNGGRVTPVQTPQSTPRRSALYERIRQKSLSNETTPTARRIISTPGTPTVTPAQLQALGQAELRRRSLLGRLSGVAESVWMFFSNSSVAATGAGGANGLALARKRRVMQMGEVVRAVIKSSPVPLSEVDAQQSLNMLAELCPFFITRVVIAGEDWLEMPSSSASSSAQPPSSPGAATAEMRTRSPRSVRNEAGGLRQVRERIRRELDDAD